MDLHHQLEQKTRDLLTEAKAMCDDDRIAIYHHINQTAPNGKVCLLALTLFTHEQLVHCSSLNTRDHEGMLLTVISLTLHSSASDNDAIFKQNTMFIQPIIKRLLRHSLKEKRS